MQIKTFPNGLLSSNAYVVWDKNECMIVDLGVKVFLAEEADLCIIKGAGVVADNIDKMSDNNSYVFTKF